MERSSRSQSTYLRPQRVQTTGAGSLGEPTNWIAIAHTDPDGNPMAGQNYKIYFADGSVIAGTLDAAGQASHDNVPKVGDRVEYEPRQPEDEPSWPDLDQMIQAAQQKLG